MISWEFATNRRWKRILVALTFPLWAIPMVLICFSMAFWWTAWEGLPGKVLRWIWNGEEVR